LHEIARDENVTLVLLLGADVRVGAEAVPVYADDDDDEQLVCGTASTPIARR